MDWLLNLAGKTEDSKLWNLIADPDRSYWVDREVPCSVQFSPHHVHWGFQLMPVAHADKHFLIGGVSGAGKTTLVRLLIQSIAPRLLLGNNEQIIIFDPKGDVLPILSGLGFDDEADNVWILNPFDARSCVWDIAEAMQSPALARYLGSLLVPAEEHSSAPFFWQAARELVWAVTIALNESRGTSWTLRDLICAFDKKELVMGVCNRLVRSQRLADLVFADDKHSPGVLTTLLTKLGPFQTAAALWHSKKDARKFSVTEFLSRPGILVLGHDDTYKDSIKPINAMLLRALTDEILRRPNHSGPRHWFILDEFPVMGKTDFAKDLLNRGRSKGVSFMMGFQSKEGMNACYNENEADQLMSDCANKVFLRAGSPKTSQWMEQYFGNVRSTEVSVSETTNEKGETTRSTSWATHDRPQFNSSFFSSLPFPEPGGILKLVADGPGTGPVVASRDFSEVLTWMKPLGPAPGVLHRNDIASQLLEPWDEREIELNCGAYARPSGALPKRRPGSRKSSDSGPRGSRSKSDET